MTTRCLLVLPILVALVTSWAFGSDLQFAVAPCEGPLADSRVRLYVERDAAGAPEKLIFKVRGREDLKATVRLQGGDLYFNLKLKDENAADRALTGREVYRRALAVFGERVRGIYGVWSEGDNLDVFNWLTGRGWSLERAARETWTGRTNALFGFTEVYFVVLEGTPGQYTAVMAQFERPRRVARRFRTGRSRFGTILKRDAAKGVDPI